MLHRPVEVNAEPSCWAIRFEGLISSKSLLKTSLKATN
jgi:hypothetical protein